MSDPCRLAKVDPFGVQWDNPLYDPLKGIRNPPSAGCYDGFNAVSRTKQNALKPIPLESLYDALCTRCSLGELPNGVLGALFIEGQDTRKSNTHLKLAAALHRRPTVE
jgi:hypothetical protein